VHTRKIIGYRFALSGIVSVLCLALVGCGDDILTASTHHNYDMFKSILDNADDALEASPQAQRREQCALEKGQWAKEVYVGPCRDGVAELTVDGAMQLQTCDGGDGDLFEGMCVHYDRGGLVYFNDGPTVPAVMLQASSLLGESLDQMRYAPIFWSAGVAHDYCYHHNPITRGLSQQDCDDQFLSDLSAVCSQPNHDKPWFDKTGCDTYAASLYAAVHAGGAASYEVLNTRVDYPLWQPLWRQFGMTEEAVDLELKAQIDNAVEYL
jgi:hypothetical protein